MEKPDELSFIGGSAQGSFVSYMFSMTDGEKVELINMFQYIILAIIPVILIVRLMKTYIPPVNNKKGSAEVTIELIVQLVVLVSFFFVIHKLILFIPTYTKQNYPSIQFFPVLLPLLFILFTLDKNMGEKAQLLLQRGLVLIGINKENFEGADLEEEEKNQGQVSQNVSGQVCNQQMMPPQMSNPVMMEPPVRKTDKQNPQQYQQYGIQEPSAANDFGGYTAF
jgi:hypothetical protein